MSLDQFYSWLAGFVDGEGSITVSKRHDSGYESYRVDLTIVNTNYAALSEIRSTIGFGSLRERSRKGALGKKPCYELQFCKAQAREVIPLILPYLKVKKAQAQLLLEFPIQRHLSKIGHSGGGRIVDISTKQKQHEAYLKMHELNCG
jgi:intein-encoded DNA endonuclease-like protein